MFVTLVPKGARTGPLPVTLTRLRRHLATLPGTPTFLLPAQELRIGGRSGNSLYQYTLLAESFDELGLWIPRLQARLRALPELVDVSADQQGKGLMTSIDIDRTTASRMGITPEDVDAALYAAFGQSLVGVSYSDLNQYHGNHQAGRSPEGLAGLAAKYSVSRNISNNFLIGGEGLRREKALPRSWQRRRTPSSSPTPELSMRPVAKALGGESRIKVPAKIAQGKGQPADGETDDDSSFERF